MKVREFSFVETAISCCEKGRRWREADAAFYIAERSKDLCLYGIILESSDVMRMLMEAKQF